MLNHPSKLFQRIPLLIEIGVHEGTFSKAVKSSRSHSRVMLIKCPRGHQWPKEFFCRLTRLVLACFAWGEMARQVAHEIKNPLTPIRLGVQHLQRAYVDARGDFDQVLGANVTRILAEIDPIQYGAQVNQASAQVLSQKAQVESSNANATAAKVAF